MRRMCLDDHGASCREGSYRVSASDSKRERQVAGLEDSNGSDGDQHTAEIRQGRGRIRRIRRIYRGFDVSTVVEQRSEGACLEERTNQLPSQPPRAEPSFGLSHLDNRVSMRLEGRSDGLEQ